MRKKVFCVILQRKRNSVEKMKNSKEENNRSEAKQKIVEATLELFFKHGIKDVKMDDIASHISVSKRTIYELFTDKEILVAEALKHHQQIMHAKAREIIKGSTDIFDVILSLYNLYFDNLKNINKKFFTDLDRYPDVRNRNKERDKRNEKKFIAWMEEGRRQGLFREDADFKILAFILKRDLELIMTINKQTPDNELSNYTPDQLGRLLILFYLRGIATAKGREKIEEFIKSNK